MDSDLLHDILSRALKALMYLSKDEIQHLTLSDCAFILDTLSITDSSASTRTHLAERLSQQLSPNWIDDGDLFEVFLVLSVLWKYDPQRVSGEHLAYAIQRLVRSEVRVGGPYASNDVIDITANLQIATFVQTVAKPLPGLDAFFDQIITTGCLKDTTRNKPYALYLLAKLYRCPEVTHFIEDHRTETPMRHAMTLAISSHTTHSQQELLALCNSQQPNGFWQPESLLGEQVRSPIATTALITKFLTIYRDNNDSMKPRASLQRRHQQVAYTTKQLFESHAEPLCHSTLASIDKICSSKRTFEITLLSYSFAQALQHPISLTDQQLALLGAANVCGWVAYSIYDDFLDDEGTPSQLPVANVAMRASLECFRTMPPRRRDFERYVAKVFNEMDEANAWEIDNCRFIVRGNTVTIDHLPRYGRQAMLAARSFAHALGPMAILIKHTKSTPSQIRYIESAFRHYLIARQLSDDLHDWTDDMKAGQASYVVIAILRDMRLRSGAYDLPDLLSRMRKQFRHTTMPRICRLALRHIDQAKRNFTRSELLQTSNSIYVLLDELESSLHSWLDQHEKAEALVKAPVSYST